MSRSTRLLARSPAALLVSASFAAPALAEWSSDAAINLPIADGASDQSQPKLSPTPDAGVYVTWLDGIGTGWDVRIQKLDDTGSKLFSVNGELVADRSFSSTQDYGLATEASGDAYVAFRDDRSTGVQISAARIGVNGATLWGPDGVQLTETAEFVAAPGVAGTSDGSAVVAWTQGSSTHVMKLDGFGIPAWTEDVVFTPPSGGYSFNNIQVAGTGVVVSMTHETGGFGAPRHLVAQKLDSDGVPLWGASPLAVFDGGSLQFGNFPDFLPDGSGGGVFAWYDTASSQLQSYVQRVLADGTEVFPHNGVAVAIAASRNRVSPSPAFDVSSQEITVFWNELNSAQSQSGVYGQRVAADGTRLWGESGTEVSAVGVASVSQVRAALLSAGAFAFWSSAPSFGTNVLLGARINDDGAIDVGPFDVASTPSGKSRLVGVTTTSDQVVLAWGDDRDDAGDILGQNVNADGSLGNGTVAVPTSDAADVRVLHPNPVSTSGIRLEVLDPSAVRLDIFTASGRLVKSFDVGAAGSIVVWDLQTESGERVAAGVFYHRLIRAGGVIATGRFVVL